jgi:uncharacterized protein YukE
MKAKDIDNFAKNVAQVANAFAPMLKEFEKQNPDAFKQIETEFNSTNGEINDRVKELKKELYLLQQKISSLNGNPRH